MKKLVAWLLALALLLSCSPIAPLPANASTTATVVDAPVAGTAYKFGMVQQNLNNQLYYITGVKGGYNNIYLATTLTAAQAADVYLEETTGGYYLYTLVSGAKKYINMVVSGTYVNGEYEDAASTVYTYDAESKTVVATVNGSLYWFGTRNDRNYDTVGPVKTTYNGFYCQFYTVSEAETPDTPVDPEEPETPEDGTVLTIAEALEMGASMTHNSYTTVKYKVTGTITQVYNTAYGNMYITDGEGNTLTIYGTYDATGEISYSAMEVKPDAGDTVTIYGAIGNYNGNAQIKNGWIVAHTPGESEAPEIPALPTEDGAEVSIADALAYGNAVEHGVYSETKYKVTGEITEVYNTTYGNMYITDGEGNTLTIYGTYDATGETGYSAMDVQPVAGDTVTIYGAIGNYNGKAQIKNGWIVAHVPAKTEPENPDEVFYTYTVTDGKATITAYSGTGGNITIPATLGGYPVTVIGAQVFWNRSSLTSVTIPDSIITIDNEAFKFCENLISVTFGGNVATIGDAAFEYCENLAFVNLPNSLITIGDSAFSTCENMTTAVIGNSVTTIGNGAFNLCTSLVSVNIPASVTAIGTEAFDQCYSLTGIWVDENNPSYSSDAAGVLFDKAKTTLIQGPGAISGSYIVPDSVITIAAGAFCDYDRLSSVTIGDSVTTIGNFAFCDCNGLTTLTIGGSVTTIGADAFKFCENLTTVTMGDSVATIGDLAFEACERLTDVYYAGTEAQWAQIVIGAQNWSLTNANIHFESEVPGTPEVPDVIVGDLDGVVGIDEDDAIYLLRHILMPNLFEVDQDVDFNGDGKVNEDDAIQLLRHVLMPELFPLK